MYRNYSISPASLHGPEDIFRSRGWAVGPGSWWRWSESELDSGFGLVGGNRGPFDRIEDSIHMEKQLNS
jgi:hypothetical protein